MGDCSSSFLSLILSLTMDYIIGDMRYTFFTIPGHGMSSEALSSQIWSPDDFSGESQVVIIYAFHESLADYDRFTGFFAGILQKGLDAKREVIFVQEDIGASLQEMRADHDELCRPDILTNPKYQELLRTHWTEYKQSAEDRIMRVINDKAGVYHYPTQFAGLLMSHARAGRIKLDFEEITFEAWLKWESGMVAFEDNLLMLSCGQVDAETFITRAQESTDAIKQGDRARDIRFAQQLRGLVGDDSRRLVITHRGIGHYGMHDILQQQGVNPVVFSITQPNDFPSSVKLTFERTADRPYSETETMLVMRVAFSVMLRPAVRAMVGDTLECHLITDAIGKRITKEEFLQLFQHIADANSPGRVVPNLYSWLKQNEKLGEQEKYFTSSSQFF
jgi:hypothetical protein